MTIYEERLSKLPLLEGLDEEEYNHVSGLFSEEHYPKGTHVVVEGYGGLKLYLLVEGKVTVFKTMDGARVTITTLEPQDTFGELSIIDGLPASAGVEAETDVSALTLSRDDFYKVLKSSDSLEAKIFRNLLKTFCRRLRSTTNQVQDYFGINKALCENESFREFYKLVYS